VEALARRTGASTGCGSCKALLTEYVGGEQAAAMEKGARPLLVLAALTMAFAALVVVLRPLSVAQNVGFRLSAFWSDRALKEVSGFAMAGSMALSLLISARKRLRRVKAGSFATWRAGHAGLGLLTLGLLVLHTGLRLGEHINRWLMGDVLAILVAGAIAAVVTALDYRFPAKLAQAVRTACNRSHIVLFWPLPVLVLFHIFLVYYF
jgi:nitrite reductase (NADH) large subunit